MIHPLRRRPLRSIASVAVLAAVGLIVAQPGTAACAVIDALPLDRLPDSSRADTGLSPADRQAAGRLHDAALARIGRMFGPPRAQPVIVHVSRPDALWPFTVNGYGWTVFLPGRTCVLIGPNGRNVDVMAHELVHAEIADRVGYRRRSTQLPIWFDEGAAMQVDRRPAFVASVVGNPEDMAPLRSSGTHAAFFDVPLPQLVRHYAWSRAEVARWLNRIGHASFYAGLERVRSGERFADIWNDHEAR